ncbi:MAG: tRNA uridine-5-carboxymethylaminomethyl(34) synthesis GTPase MnmE, partial [Oxalobacteraceae bacterium]
MQAGDTIMALSSGALPSGVAVIRLSGPKVREAFLSLAGALPAPRTMALR